MRDGESKREREMGQVAFPHQWMRLHFGDWILVIIIKEKLLSPTHDFGCIQQIIVLRERERETCDL